MYRDRHSSVVGFWDSLAAMGPAWGMIGTLIGLINMLQKMEDAKAIGPAMAVALIHLHGFSLANCGYMHCAQSLEQKIPVKLW